MIQINNSLIFQINAFDKIFSLIEKKSYRSVTVLIDKNVENKSDYWIEFQKLLNNSTDLTVVIVEANAEPTYSYLDEISNIIRKINKIDLIIGIGGGSTLDLAKAVAALRNNPGPALNYRGFDKLMNPPISTMCIPTTAGTGSEVTINAVFIDEKENRKLGINGRHMNATYSVLDSKWIENIPLEVMKSAGLDALVHSLESYMTKNSNYFTKKISALAFNEVIKNLPLAVQDNRNLEVLQSLLTGSYFAGLALYNSGSGISGAMSYPLGVYFRVPHGFAGGITLPSVLKFNHDSGWLGLSDLFEGNISNLDTKSKSQYVIELIEKTYETINVPKNFDRWNISKSDLDFILDKFATLEPAFSQNPVNFLIEPDARNLISKHLSN